MSTVRAQGPSRPRPAAIAPGLRSRAIALAAACLLPLLAAGCTRSEAPSRTIVLSGPAMGTTWTVSIVGPEGGMPSERSRAIDAGIRDELVRINQLMSTWDPESELSRFNRSASTEPFPVAPETFDVFEWSRRLYEETGGALDPTIAPLIDAWGFGVDRDVTTPDDETVARLKATTGMTLVELDPGRAWVRKLRPEVRVDFSAIAPGYAADRIAARLEEQGLTDFLIDVSGELVARGHNESGQPWQVGVERPQRQGRRATRVVPLTDMAIATSGDYRNFREVDGQRFTHVLDPRTGRPVNHALASVTVVDELGVRADALSTALMAMGPDEAMAFATARDLPALFLIRLPDGSFEERMSPAFERSLASGTSSGDPQ